MTDALRLIDDARLREASDWWLRLQDVAGAEQTAEWMAWTQQHPDNLVAFDRIASMALELTAVSKEDRAELLQALAPEPAPALNIPRRKKFVRSTGKWLAIAATLSAVVAGVIHFQPEPSTATTYSTERALHQNLTLVDGSRVVVGASTQLVFQMQEHQRLVELRSGEAFFEVQKDPVRPFVVDVGGLSVTAVGTAFDVRRTGERVTVSVTEGRVRVDPPGGESLMLGAGERLAYEPTTHSFKLSRVAPERVAAWREQRLEFVNETLDVVIANINRYAAIEMRVDPQVASLTFTGTVSPEDLNSWLNALPEVLPVQVRREKNEVRITTR